ncbi:YEATS domain-containing protein 4 [Myotis brandtii]|uniref:YEATS domain-containing protein 4 n=1 Tax=Myotis brandtii TaxID=109478 RepID=S7MWV6_MYOBR|nr:YEATS domain-containing protein 4 [Myotis brandtii]
MKQQLLKTSCQLTLGAYKHETILAELEVKTTEKLEAGKKSFEIAELKERFKASCETTNCLKNEIRKLEDDQKKRLLNCSEENLTIGYTENKVDFKGKMDCNAIIFLEELDI